VEDAGQQMLDHVRGATESRRGTIAMNAAGGLLAIAALAFGRAAAVCDYP
jgi:hypothetical protein